MKISTLLSALRKAERSRLARDTYHARKMRLLANKLERRIIERFENRFAEGANAGIDAQVRLDMQRLQSQFVECMQSIDPECVELVNKHFWELLA